jgi:hypothetical protein
VSPRAEWGSRPRERALESEGRSPFEIRGFQKTGRVRGPRSLVRSRYGCRSLAHLNSEKQDNWVPTWGTAQQLVRTPPPVVVPVPSTGGALTATAPAASAPATAPAAPGQATTPGLAATSSGAQRGRGPAGAVFRVTTLSNQTVRMIVRTSIGDGGRE